MKVIKKFTWVLLLTLCSTTLFVGCSDDDDNDGKEPEVGGKIDPSNVFTGKLPKSYAGSAVTYNSDGLVEKINSDDEVVTFTYPSTKTRAEDKKRVVRMTIYDSHYPEYGTGIFDMTIGDNGYVESCKETNDLDSEVDETWVFGYNSDGQLNYMMRSENDNRKTRITYTNGDITKVEETSDIDEHYSGTVSYGANPIENKGCIMLFSKVFSIDIDEMQFAYLAGLLGKATKHLPVGYTDTSYENGSKYDFAWSLDSNSYPVTATIDGEEYKFAWQ